MPSLQQKVAVFIHKHALLQPGDRVGVAVSGGADSVALLRLLLDLRGSLGIVLAVVHFNHLLRREESDGDERFVADLARECELVFFCDRGDVAACSKNEHLSLETAARTLRYEYFFRLLREGRLTRIATAHTIDDQAETVLLRLLRGAGTRGLAGIYPLRAVAGSQLPGKAARSKDAAIIRPLLGVRRPELETHLNSIHQDWREDSSNRDLRHARNRIRHGILPRLERSLNPSVRETLAETAEIARDEEAYWSRQIAEILPRVWKQDCLRISELSLLPLALQRRMIRAAAESLHLNLEFKHVEEIIAISAGDAQAAALPKGWRASREAGSICLIPPGLVKIDADFDYILPVPGRVEVPEAAACFEASLVPRDSEGYNPNDLFGEKYAAAQLCVRNWRAGDRFWPAHARSPKKVKELLQERHITGTERKLWPVVASGDELLWLRGFSARRPDHRHDQNLNGSRALLIREIPLQTGK
ncbi:MAG: tRNA lysidine(34) synthetase TilS [Terriglobales bacterium]